MLPIESSSLFVLASNIFLYIKRCIHLIKVYQLFSKMQIRIIVIHFIYCSSLHNNCLLSIKILIYAAGACTLIAGILHLSLASNVIGLNLPVGIFLVAGIGQIFWTLPIV